MSNPKSKPNVDTAVQSSKSTMSNNAEAASSSISSTFSLTVKNETEETRFEKLSSLKKLLQKELNKSITVEECDVVLLAGALLLNDSNAVKEQARLVNDINIRLWGNAVDSLSNWIEQYGLLQLSTATSSSSSSSSTQSMSKFIEGNTALHFAVLTGNFENIAFLLSKQADPFLKNANGDKPLELSHDYHRKKLHSKSERRRSKSKRHKSKRDRKASKSHRSHHHHHHRHHHKTKSKKKGHYEHEADDENDSEFDYHRNSQDTNTPRDDDDCESISSASSGSSSSSSLSCSSSSSVSSSSVSSCASSCSHTSQSPMHLSRTDFDELFSNAVSDVLQKHGKEKGGKASHKTTTSKEDETKSSGNKSSALQNTNSGTKSNLSNAQNSTKTKNANNSNTNSHKTSKAKPKTMKKAKMSKSQKSSNYFSIRQKANKNNKNRNKNKRMSGNNNRRNAKMKNRNNKKMNNANQNKKQNSNNNNSNHGNNNNQTNGGKQSQTQSSNSANSNNNKRGNNNNNTANNNGTNDNSLNLDICGLDKPCLRPQNSISLSSTSSLTSSSLSDGERSMSSSSSSHSSDDSSSSQSRSISDSDDCDSDSRSVSSSTTLSDSDSSSCTSSTSYHRHHHHGRHRHHHHHRRRECPDMAININRDKQGNIISTSMYSLHDHKDGLRIKKVPFNPKLDGKALSEQKANVDASGNDKKLQMDDTQLNEVEDRPNRGYLPDSSSSDDEVHFSEHSEPDSSSMDSSASFTSSGSEIEEKESEELCKQNNQNQDDDNKEQKDSDNDGDAVKLDDDEEEDEEEEVDVNAEEAANGPTASSLALIKTSSNIDSLKDQHSAINKLLKQTMEQKRKQRQEMKKLRLSENKNDDKALIDDLDNENGTGASENDLHSQLVPIILALSEINIFAESASLAKMVKFICTLIFFVALHWLDGNSTAKMIVKAVVSIVYLLAMFGHRINEWKECIDAETVLRKQQWSKQRDKERQKRKDRLQKTLRNPDSKRCIAKKQRKLERDTCHKQDLFDWRSRIRMMINHAESAFLQKKWEMAEVYFSRLLSFLMETESDANILLNERKRSNLKINRRWKGVFDDHYTIPMAKMFSRRAYCLCKLENNTQPRGAPATIVSSTISGSNSSNSLITAAVNTNGIDNNNVDIMSYHKNNYKTIHGHLELAIKDLTVAISLREISPLYQQFAALSDDSHHSQCNENSTNNANANTKQTQKDSEKQRKLDTLMEQKLDRLLPILCSQLSDLISLSGLNDLTNKFENAYSAILQADHIIHSLNRFNRQYQIQKNCPKLSHLLDKTGNFKLRIHDSIPLRDVQNAINNMGDKVGNNKKKKKQATVKLNEQKLFSVAQKFNENNLDSIEDEELDKLLTSPLRNMVDLSCYQQLHGMEKGAVSVQSIIDEQLKKIRLLRLQAANRRRAENLKNQREKAKHAKLKHDKLASSADDFHKRKNKKDRLKTKANAKEKIEKLKGKQKDKEHIVSKTKHEDKADTALYDVDEEDVKMDEKQDKMSQLQLVKAPVISVNATRPSLNTVPSTPSSIASTTTSGVEASSSMGSESPSNITNDTNMTESMSTNIASITTSIMEYGTAFSVIRSDKEDDEEETKMSMVSNKEMQSSLVMANKNKLKRKSKVKLNKIRRKNKHKASKKKTKKKGEILATKKAEDADDRMSISSDTQSHQSQLSKTPSVEEDLEDLDEEEEEEEEEEEDEDEQEDEGTREEAGEETEPAEDDSLSTLSESASTDSAKSSNASTTTHNKEQTASHRKKSGNHRNHKNRSKANSNQRQYQVYNKHSPNETKTYRRKRGSSLNADKKANNGQKEGEAVTDDEPRQHWLWNVNCDFWPNCRNSEQCPFRHPTDKGAVIRRKRTAKSGDNLGKPIMCRFGRECSRIDCWFWHPEDQETFIDPSSIPTSPKSANMQIKLNSTSPTHSLTMAAMSSTTPKQSASSAVPIAFSRDRTVSSHSVSSSNTDSIHANTTVSVHTDHSYETTEEAQSNHGSDFSPLRSTTAELERAVSATSTASTVIISKKPKTNPWNKNKLKPKPKPKAKGKQKPKPLSKVPPSKAGKGRKTNPVPPLTAPITVGAVYPPRNSRSHDYALTAQYNINNMLPSGNKQKGGKQSSNSLKRRKNAKESSTYLTADGKKITSKLNPNASEFEFAAQAHFSSSSAPIRPPIRTTYFSPMMGMHAQQQQQQPQPQHLNKHKYVGNLSPPFDPHSQLQNGGVFSPHNNVFSPTSTNSNHSNEMKGFHGNMQVPPPNHNNGNTHNNKNNIHNNIHDSMRSTSTSTTTTTKTTTTTTISTITQQTVNNNTTHHLSMPPLGTYIASPRHNDSAPAAAAAAAAKTETDNAAVSGSSNPWQSEAYHPNNYPYDEYKQAPNASSSSGGYYGNNNNSHRTHNAMSGYSFNDTGDESKVIDEGQHDHIHATSHDHTVGENYHRDRDDVDSVHSPPSHHHHSQQTESHDGDRNPAAASHPWICPSCSFLNEIGTTACDLCSSARPINEPEESPLDFDFNVQDVVNDVLAESNDEEGAQGDEDKEEAHSERNLSFNAIFYGHGSTESTSTLPFHSNSKLSQFSVGDHVLCHSNHGDATSSAGSIQGSIVDIDAKSPYPIRIEYYATNEFDKAVQKFMWVGPAELVKTSTPSFVQQQPVSTTYPEYNDELYDYDDEEDDD